MSIVITALIHTHYALEFTLNHILIVSKWKSSQLYSIELNRRLKFSLMVDNFFLFRPFFHFLRIWFFFFCFLENFNVAPWWKNNYAPKMKSCKIDRFTIANEWIKWVVIQNRNEGWSSVGPINRQIDTRKTKICFKNEAYTTNIQTKNNGKTKQ